MSVGNVAVFVCNEIVAVCCYITANTTDYSIVRLECTSVCRRCPSLCTLSSGGISWRNGSPSSCSGWSPSLDAIKSVEAQSRQDSTYLAWKPIPAPENWSPTPLCQIPGSRVPGFGDWPWSYSGRGADHVNACWKHLSLGVLPSSSVATHPSASDRRNSCHTGSRVCSDQDRLLQRSPGWSHEATTEPASDGSQHCSSSTPANTEVRTHIVGDHRHPTLVACARSPHLQDMLSRQEQCCGCWSVIPMRTLHLVVGRLGTSTAFFNRFAPEGALLPLGHNTATCLKIAVTGPTSWNSIPLQLRLLSNDRGHALTFKKQLKFSLFPQNFLAQTGTLSWTGFKCVAEIILCRDAIPNLNYIHTYIQCWRNLF